MTLVGHGIDNGSMLLIAAGFFTALPLHASAKHALFGREHVLHGSTAAHFS